MEGRSELQRVIMHYEKQRAEALRNKQEAEIVLPFVRAALEELDAATGQTDKNEVAVMGRVQSQVDSARAAQAPATFESGNQPVANGNEFRMSPPEDAAAGRASIASLIEEANEKAN